MRFKHRIPKQTGKHPRTTSHNHQKAMAKFAEQKGMKPGQVNHLAVEHDGWCDLLTSRGYCNCNVTVRLMAHAPKPEHN